MVLISLVKAVTRDFLVTLTKVGMAMAASNPIIETVIIISISVNPRFAFEWVLMVFFRWLIRLNGRIGLAYDRRLIRSIYLRTEIDLLL